MLPVHKPKVTQRFDVVCTGTTGGLERSGADAEAVATKDKVFDVSGCEKLSKGCERCGASDRSGSSKCQVSGVSQGAMGEARQAKQKQNRR